MQLQSKPNVRPIADFRTGSALHHFRPPGEFCPTYKAERKGHMVMCDDTVRVQSLSVTKVLWLGRTLDYYLLWIHTKRQHLR